MSLKWGPYLTSLRASTEAENEVTQFDPTFWAWPKIKIIFHKKLLDRNKNFKNLISKCFLYCLKI